MASPAKKQIDSLKFSRTNNQAGEDRVCTRIDRFYVPVAQVDRVCSYGILPGVAKADHSPIRLCWATTEDGIVYSDAFHQFYRMNTDLLRREGVREQIEGRWKEFQQHPTGSAFGRFVDALQATTRLCRKLGKKFQDEANRQENKLTDEFTALQRAAEEDMLNDEDEALFPSGQT